MLDEAAVSYQAILTKLDKLSQEAQGKAKEALAVQLKTHVAAHPEILATSAEKGWGLDEARDALAAILNGG
jgi:GTP-binding protein